MRYNLLSIMSYEQLAEYLVTCHYAEDHDSAIMTMREMERRYPERYYNDLYGDD